MSAMGNTSNVSEMGSASNESGIVNPTDESYVSKISLSRISSKDFLVLRDKNTKRFNFSHVI